MIVDIAKGLIYFLRVSAEGSRLAPDKCENTKEHGPNCPLSRINRYGTGNNQLHPILSSPRKPLWTRML
jgi:hypothetical protein